jgi:hypothetical protein
LDDTDVPALGESGQPPITTTLVRQAWPALDGGNRVRPVRLSYTAAVIFPCLPAR